MTLECNLLAYTGTGKFYTVVQNRLNKSSTVEQCYAIHRSIMYANYVLLSVSNTGTLLGLLQNILCSKNSSRLRRHFPVWTWNISIDTTFKI